MGSAETTRSRILRAAAQEFAQYGIAGARVRRIAADAGVNGERIYAYFGDKNSLYLQVLEDGLSQMAAAVPLDPADVLGWVGRVFDYTLENEELTRLAMWGQLEGVHNDLREDHPRMVSYRIKLAAIRDAQESAKIDSSWRDTDLFVLLSALATAWRRASLEIKQLDRAHGDDPALDAHRQAAIEAARRILEPRQATEQLKRTAKTATG